MSKQVIELAALILFLAVLFFLRKKERTAQESVKRREELLIDYPDIVSQMVLFLGAGMTIRSALEQMGRDYGMKREQTGKRRPAYEEIILTLREIKRGVTEEEAYRRMGDRIAIPRYRTFITLLIQHLKKGNEQLREILEKEAAQILEERKRKARIYGEQASTRMLFPMILMLLDVLIILLVPAFMSFY